MPDENTFLAASREGAMNLFCGFRAFTCGTYLNSVVDAAGAAEAAGAGGAVNALDAGLRAGWGGTKKRRCIVCIRIDEETKKQGECIVCIRTDEKYRKHHSPEQPAWKQWVASLFSFWRGA